MTFLLMEMMVLVQGLSFMSGGYIASLAVSELKDARMALHILTVLAVAIATPIALSHLSLSMVLIIAFTAIIAALFAMQKDSGRRITLLPLVALISIASWSPEAIIISCCTGIFSGISAFDKQKSKSSILGVAIPYYYLATSYIIIMPTVLLLAIYLPLL